MIQALPGAALVVAAAFIAAIGPQRLLADLDDRDADWRRGLRLAGLTAAVGLAVFAAAALRIDLRVAAALGALAATLLAAAVIDARWLVIPDLHVAAVALLALANPLALPRQDMALGALVGGGLLLAARALFLRYRGVEALGLGDVKLMAALGCLAGPTCVLWIIAAGSGVGVAWGVLRRSSGALMIPFGAATAAPALALIAAVALGWRPSP